MKQKYEQSLEIMDNEAVSPESVDSLINDKDSHDAWYRFHLIRDVIQDKTSDVIAPDLHIRIAEAIADEPTLLVPDARREVAGWRRKITQWGEQLTSYAIAASVTTFILFSVQQMQTPEIENSSAITTLELIEPTDYQLANNELSPMQENLLDLSRMSSIYGGQHMGKYVQGVNYSIAIPLKPITEKKVLEPETTEIVTSDIESPEQSETDKPEQP